MVTSSGADPKVFESKEWDPYIVENDGDRVWFGHPWQKNASMICFMFTFAFVVIGLGILFEGKGLRANLKDPTALIAGTGALLLASLVAWGGAVLLKRTNRVAMLDLENRHFCTINRRNGNTKDVFPCEDLYIRLMEVRPLDTDAEFHGKITIIGPEKPDEGRTEPDVDVTIFRYLRFKDVVKAIRELQKAASWKGIIGEELLISLYRSAEQE